MRISFYTIDDLRLGHDPKGVTGWRLSQFLNWRDALEHYYSLPNDRVKEFGLSNGVQVLQLVRCLPLFPGDRRGHDVLLTDGIVQPLWRAEPRAAETARTVVTHLDITTGSFPPRSRCRSIWRMSACRMAPARSGGCAWPARAGSRRRSWSGGLRPTSGTIATRWS